MNCEKAYAVIAESDYDGETESGILGNGFYCNRGEARKAMLADLKREREQLDEGDDFDESVDEDFCALSANGKWSCRWRVVELRKLPE